MNSVSRISHEPEPAIPNAVDWAGLITPPFSRGTKSLSNGP
jgi:hypothetical protein